MTGPVRITPQIHMVGGPDLTDPADCCVYLVKAEDDTAALIDTGGGTSFQKILGNIHRAGVDPTSVSLVILTHAHVDHIGGASLAKQQLGAQLVAHQGDVEAIATGDPILTAANWYGVRLPPVEVDTVISGDDYALNLGDDRLRLIHTPGHTPGSISVLFESGGKKVLFGQDVHGPFNSAFGSDVSAWAASMKKLIELEADVLAEGHYGVIEGKRAVADFIRGHLRLQGYGD